MEIHKAVALKYRSHRIYEVYHCVKKTSVYDPNTGKGGLFAEYMNQLIKLMQENGICVA